VYELLRGVVALHARLAGFLAQLRAGGFLQCSLASLAAVRCNSALLLAMKVGIGSMLPTPKHRSHSDRLYPHSQAQAVFYKESAVLRLHRAARASSCCWRRWRAWARCCWRWSGAYPGRRASAPSSRTCGAGAAHRRAVAPVCAGRLGARRGRMSPCGWQCGDRGPRPRRLGAGRLAAPDEAHS
jgi:hypothetical protein